MIKKDFIENKFFRNYIGGSRKAENQIFLDVQGVSNETLECDWFEYRRILIDYFNDNTNVLFSWFNLLKYLGYIFLGISVLTIQSPVLAAIIFLISIGLYVTSKVIEKKLLRTLQGYDMSLTLVVREIEKNSGLKLAKTH